MCYRAFREVLVIVAWGGVDGSGGGGCGGVRRKVVKVKCSL